MPSFKEKIQAIADMSKFGDYTDAELMRKLVESAEDCGLSTMEIVLAVAEYSKKKAKAREQEMWLGSEQALNNFVHICRTHERGKRVGDVLNGHYFNADKGSVVQFLYMLRATIPNPEKGGYSDTTTWMLRKVLGTFNLNRFLTGDDAKWAESMGHTEYIKKLIKAKEVLLAKED